MPKIVLFFCFMAVCLLAVWWVWPDENGHIILCDVGQGDAILFQIKFLQILVDTGPANGNVSGCLREYMPFWDRNIEYVILTHPDADHIGGFPSLIESYAISHVGFNPTEKSTELVVNIQKLLDEHRIQPQMLRQGDRLRWVTGDVEVIFDVIWPDEELLLPVEKRSISPETNLSQREKSILEKKRLFSDANLQSISGYMRLGTLDVLLTGDIDVQVEQALMEEGLLERVEVLKIAHHGSKTSTSNELLSAVVPEIALMGVGRKNSYGHPSDQVINLLKKKNIKILSTAELGTVEIITTGKEYWMIKP